MNFRKACLTDLPQLRSVYAGIIDRMNHEDLQIWDEVYPCDYFAEDIENNRLYVLLDGDVIVSAFALCSSNDGSKQVEWISREAKALYIDRLGVNTDYARRGIGEAMLKKAMELAHFAGAEYLRLFVVDTNEPAARLYEKCGFTKATGIYDEVIDEELTLHEFGYEKAAVAREYFMRSDRIGFSVWRETDLELAQMLWGSRNVTRFICAAGEFTAQDIANRLETEIKNGRLHRIQYWPIFDLNNDELIGCCGLRPFKEEADAYELGIHLREKFWGKGYASEAAKAVIAYSFKTLEAKKLYAGHHPDNAASQKLLTKLGFHYIGQNFYEPTGLYHPSYELKA